MRKCYTNSHLKNYSLIIITILAITSIFLQLSSPENKIIAKIESEDKIDLHEEKDSLSEQHLDLKDSIDISDTKKNKETGKALAVQIENKAIPNKTTTKRTKLVLVTAYSSTVDQTDSTPFITANGTHVHDGTIAANFLKFGTKVKFPSLYGDKIFTVEDRMKSDYKVDIWFPTRQEALNFGAKRVEIEIQ